MTTAAVGDPAAVVAIGMSGVALVLVLALAAWVLSRRGR
jgi:hypothetical protein